MKNSSLDEFRDAANVFCQRCYAFSIYDLGEFPLDDYFRVGHTPLEAAHAAARFRSQGQRATSR